MTSLAHTERPTGSRILGLGHYRPERVVTNQDLIDQGVDTDDEWIRSRVGIAERHFAAEGETVVDMAEHAGAAALADAGLNAEDIDLVIVATCTADSTTPAAAPQVAARLGIPAPGAFDLNTGCAGFVYSLDTASNAILAGRSKHVLVIASERFSGHLDFADRGTCIILGDAAGAAVVGPSDTVGISPAVVGSQGQHADTIWIDEKTGFFGQEGPAVYRWATGNMPQIALEVCKRAGVETTDLAAFIPHQANLRIIDAIARRLESPGLVVAQDIVTSGNTSAATIPLAFSRMKQAGQIPSGEPVLLLGFGAGLAYGGMVVIAP